jgi:hypothetical protein
MTDTNDSKIQWIDLNGLCAKPEMYFSRNKMQNKPKLSHPKNRNTSEQQYCLFFP